MNHSTNKKNLLKNKWIRFIVIAVLFVTLVLLLLPVAGKFYLTKWLLDNGADTAVIEKIRLNPFTGKASLEGINVVLGDTTVLSNADILVDIGLMSLFKKQADIEKTVLDGVTLDIELYEDGRMRFGSYTTSLSTAETPTESEDSTISWVIMARQVTMSNCRVHFKMPDLDMNLQVDDASLVRFTTAPGDKSGAFTFRGSVDGAPVALNLSTLRILPDVIIQGTVMVDGFELDNLGDFLKPYLKPFTGRASVDGTAMFKLAETDDMFVDYDGMISLEKGHIAGDSFSVQGAPVRWEKGKVHFEHTEEKGIVIDVDGSLTGKEIGVDIPDPVIKIREPDVAIDGKVLVIIDDEVTVDTSAGFKLQHTTFSMPPLQAEATHILWRGEKRRVRFNSGTGDKELSVHVQGELLADSPSFADQDDKVRLAVDGESLSWNGEVSYLLGLTSKNSSIVQTNGRLTGNKLALKLADLLEYKQGTLTANGKSKVSLASQIKVNYNGALDLKEADLQMATVNTFAENIVWNGNGDFTLAADNSMKLVLDGGLKSKTMDAKLVESGLLFDQNSLEITTKATIDIGQNTALKGTISLTSNGFTISGDNARAPQVALEGFTIDSIEAPGGKKVIIKQAEAKGLNVGIEGKMPLKVSIPVIALTDIRTEDLATFSTAKVSAQSPVVVATKNNKNLAGLGTLEIRNIKAGLDQHVTVDRVNFDDLFFLGKSTKDKNDICRIDGARLSKIGWSPEKGMQGDSLSFAGLFCTFIREENGSFNLGKELAAMSIPGENKEKTTKKTGKKKPVANIDLKQVTLRGESGLHFEDHTLEVPFISDLAITTLQFRDINSGKPTEPASVKMIGTLDKRAPLEISGTIAPFAEDLATNMKVKLKNYPLSHLSAYTVQSVGVALASGQLKLKSKINLSDNNLDMKNEVLLKKLETSTISKELADKLDNQLPIPLDSAFSLLRDRDDNISLDVPMSGPLDGLNVGISDVLITALGKAVVPAASGYLMYALGPYGALAWVGMEVGEKMLQVRLPPVEFTPAESEIPDSLQDYFNRLAKILQDKPEADFQLCPKSSAWEFISESKKETLDEKELELDDSDKEKLMQLGQERAQNIKDYLIQNYSIDKDRLLICITGIETEKSAKPRVDIQM